MLFRFFNFTKIMVAQLPKDQPISKPTSQPPSAAPEPTSAPSTTPILDQVQQPSPTDDSAQPKVSTITENPHYVKSDSGAPVHVSGTTKDYITSDNSGSGSYISGKSDDSTYVGANGVQCSHEYSIARKGSSFSTSSPSTPYTVPSLEK